MTGSRHAVFRSSLALFGILLGALFLGACSSVRPVSSGRDGLFEKLSKLESPRYSGAKYAEPKDGPKDGNDEGAVPAEAIRPKVKNWQWPLKSVTVTSHFGNRDRDFHEGIDLRAKRGTPVHAASGGTVLFAGAGIRGYGRMVVLRHEGKLSTVYAHNSRLLVRKGQKVKKGQRIALSGNTGASSGPHLHFEIREGVAAVNPKMVLPDAARSTIARSREAARAVAVAH